MGLLSLGCPKNLADSGSIINKLKKNGVHICASPEDADIMLVNTCGFIEDAKRESVDEILRLSRLKADGKRLLVFGCLAKRYGRELLEEIPEIDALFGVGQEEDIAAYCVKSGFVGTSGRERCDGGLPDAPVMDMVVPLKIAEGCGRGCTFCVIPAIRGPFRSRDPQAILREAQEHVGSGARELVLVAQDITGFGRDLRGYGLADLLSDLGSISGDFWIRLLYLHPSGIDEGLLGAMSSGRKICSYLDVPLQHADARVLRAMGRGGSGEDYLRLVRSLRAALPGVTLRTTMIVGFPGEGEEEFGSLLDFVGRARFDRLGAFGYSREEGTPAASFKGQVPAKTRKARMDALMGLQADISLEANRALVGRRERALVEEVMPGAAVARLSCQARDIDGVTIIKGSGVMALEAGEFVEVEITGASHYDLDAVLT